MFLEEFEVHRKGSRGKRVTHKCHYSCDGCGKIIVRGRSKREIKQEFHFHSLKCNAKYRMRKHGSLTGKNPHINSSKYYPDLEMRLDSSYEAKFIRICKYLGIEFIYHPGRFKLNSLSTTYEPDFYLPKFKIYVELKGYWYKGSKEKCKEFSKTYPLIIIDGDLMNELEMVYRDRIAGWNIVGVIRASRGKV